MLDKKDAPIQSVGFEGCPDTLYVFADDTDNYLHNDFTSFLASTFYLWGYHKAF